MAASLYYFFLFTALTPLVFCPPQNRWVHKAAAAACEPEIKMSAWAEVHKTETGLVLACNR